MPIDLYQKELLNSDLAASQSTIIIRHQKMPSEPEIIAVAKLKVQLAEPWIIEFMMIAPPTCNKSRAEFHQASQAHSGPFSPILSHDTKRKIIL